MQSQCENIAFTSSLKTRMMQLQVLKEYRASLIEPLPELLDKLKCIICNGHLSCPPIWETENGDNICGRCPAPEGPAKRSKLYETLAEMMSFPCKFLPYGCMDIIQFLDLKTHEKLCEFKPVLCPIATDGSCAWKGPASQLYNHCDISHVSKILHNNSPAVKINAGKNVFKAYIMQALGRLYLLHVKVCVGSKKIYHSMRHLCNNQPECMFRIDIHKKNDNITKMAPVLPQEDYQLDEENCIAVSFNSLMDVLGPFDEIYSQISIYNKCAECRDHFKKLVFHANYGWICMECVPPVSLTLLKNFTKPAAKKDGAAKQKQTSSNK